MLAKGAYLALMTSFKGAGMKISDLRQALRKKLLQDPTCPHDAGTGGPEEGALNEVIRNRRSLRVA